MKDWRSILDYKRYLVEKAAMVPGIEGSRLRQALAELQVLIRAVEWMP